MDCRLSSNNPTVIQSLPFPVKIITHSTRSVPPSVGLNRRPYPTNGRPIITTVASSHCEGFSSLNTPLEPKSPAGKFLSRVLQDDRKSFHRAVAKQLERLVYERDGTLTRASLSLGTTDDDDDACLYRRIAELKELECRSAIEDVLYMLIFYKFSEIRVHLVPRLSKCICNGRLEIWPSKDWELESIHSLEALDMIREHLGSVVGWKRDSSVTDNWATTLIQKLHLSRIYAASILYGYFLKSASMRYQLELSLSNPSYDLGTKTGAHFALSKLWSYGLKSFAIGRIRNLQPTSVGQVSCSHGKGHEKLSSYVMGFDPEVLEMCAKPKSREAMDLIEKHCCALFGDEKSDEVISTSLASQKRFILEAVAFGSFLWDAEEYVKTVYKLKDN